MQAAEITAHRPAVPVSGPYGIMPMEAEEFS